MSSPRPTITDVARQAGVSITTVSHVLNGKGRVSPSTRELVLKTASDLGYSVPARSEGDRGSGILAMSICTVTGNPPSSFGVFQFYSEILNGAATAMLDAGYSLVMVPDGAEKTEMLARIQPEGAIVVDPGPYQPLVAYARRTGLPVVTTGRAPDGDEYWVDNDFVSSTRFAVEHLHRCGAERIAVISPPTDRSYTEDAIGAYKSWCGEVGQEEMISFTDGLGQEEAKTAAAQLLLSPSPPDGIYALLDSLAVGALEAAKEIGIPVPERLKIMATTDSPFCAAADPPITTLDLNPEQIGTEAVRSLVDMIEGRELPPPSANVPVDLIVRESCGARLAASA